MTTENGLNIKKIAAKHVQTFLHSSCRYGWFVMAQASATTLYSRRICSPTWNIMKYSLATETSRATQVDHSSSINLSPILNGTQGIVTATNLAGSVFDALLHLWFVPRWMIWSCELTSVEQSCVPKEWYIEFVMWSSWKRSNIPLGTE